MARISRMQGIFGVLDGASRTEDQPPPLGTQDTAEIRGDDIIAVPKRRMAA